MDMDDRAQQQVECTRLEGALPAIEKALDDLAPAAGGAERLQLTARQEAHLAELGAVNARLSTLRKPTSPP
jgi:hypothetical protein